MKMERIGKLKEAKCRIGRLISLEYLAKKLSKHGSKSQSKTALTTRKKRG